MQSFSLFLAPTYARILWVFLTEQFAKLQLMNDEIDQNSTPILPNGQVAVYVQLCCYLQIVKI